MVVQHDAPVITPCGHEHLEFVVNEGHRDWQCANCGVGFVPDTIMNDVLDSTAGVMSAVLWDIMERVRDRYGVDVVDDAMQNSPTEHDCEMDGHEFIDDACIHCKQTLFLGGKA